MPADRMPPIPAAQMTPDQKAAVDEIASGPRGALIGPFIPSLRSPEFMRRLQRLGEYLRYDNALGHRLTEFTILLVAGAWRQDFEWYVHAPQATKAGIDADVISEIAAGRRPVRLSEDEAIVYDVFEQIERTKAVDDALYARAVGAFGEQKVIDLVGTIGYYSTLAMLMNVAGTPAPQEGPWPKS
jgi:4-carboxymuconolactone decarboxylase